MEQKPITNMVIDAKCILDYDLTIMKIFQFNYNHPDFVDQKVMKYTIPQLKNALLKRTELNPLTICITNMTGDNKQLILNQIYQENDYDIYKYISLTGTAKLVYMMRENSSFGVTIVCKNENEEGFVKRLTKNFNTVIGYDKINPEEYNSFMFKD